MMAKWTDSDPSLYLSERSTHVLPGGLEVWDLPGRRSDDEYAEGAYNDLVCICTVCCAIVLPGRKSGFRAGFRPDANRASTTGPKPPISSGK